MNIVSGQLQRALRKLVSAWRMSRKPGKANAREIPQAIVAKYYRAIWAIDTLGPAADVDRWALREIWMNASNIAMNASGDDGALIAQDLINTLNEQCEKVIRDCEKDPERPEWEKQRDFLLGSLRRVRRACALGDIGHLHFYKRSHEAFNVELNHPVFQVGYHLWQGVVRELKDAISFTLYREKPPPHLKVEWLLDRMRRVIKACEQANIDGFEHYDPRKSALKLSSEQEGRMLWEAVREEIAKIISQAEGMGAAA